MFGMPTTGPCPSRPYTCLRKQVPKALQTPVTGLIGERRWQMRWGWGRLSVGACSLGRALQRRLQAQTPSYLARIPPPCFCRPIGLRTYPLNKVSPSRRLMNLFHVSPMASAGAPLTAGMTAGSGESIAELLVN